MKALIRAIQNKHWAIEPQYATGYYEVLDQLFDTGIIEQLKEKDLIGKAQFLGDSGFLFDEEVEDEDEEPQGNINVVPVKGVVLKYDTLCETGTKTMSKLMEEGEKDESVAFHLLDVDSGGGMVDGTAGFARTIRKAKKPVIAFVDGMAASAAYWIASQADKVVINDSTSMVGSIGTMIRFADIREMLKSEGIVEREIYADASTEKNGDIREALEGNEKPIKETLNKLNDEFIADVTNARSVDKNALTGKVFIGSEVLEMGLADKIGSLSQAVEMGYNLSNENMFSSEEKKNEFFAEMGKFFGLTPKVNSESLTKKEEEMAIEQLEAEIAEKNSLIESTNAELEGLKVQLAAEKKAKEEAIEDNKSIVAVLEDYKSELGKATEIISGYKSKESKPASEEVAVKAEETPEGVVGGFQEGEIKMILQ